jgi:cytochrome c
MKKVLFILTTGFFVMACSNGTTEAGKGTDGSKEAVASTGNSLTDNPDYQKGLALVAGSDCLTCHKTSEKNIGPAYKDVAAKYENTDANVKMLAEKVIKGGSGNWGAIPMTPHPQLKQEDVEAMVRYVLLLKK